MPVVPIAQNRVGIASVDGTKLAPADLTGTGFQAAGAVAGEIAKGIGEVREVAQHNQNIYDEAAVRQSDNMLAAQQRDITLNGPNAFYNLSGSDAVGAAQPTIERLAAASEAIKAGLKNDAQKRMYQELADRRLQPEYDTITKHADTQLAVYNNDESTARGKLAADNAVTHADDPERFADEMARGGHEVAFQTKGMGADVAALKQQEWASSVFTRVVDAKSTTDPMAAQAYYRDHYDDITPGDRLNIEKALRGPVLEQQGEANVDHLLAGGATPTEDQHTAAAAVTDHTAKPVANGRAVVASIYPGAYITQVERDPNSALGRANPDSWHNHTKAAVDIRPIPGMTFDQYIGGYQRAGYTIIEKKNEVGAGRSAWATGDHWHVVLGQPGSGAAAKPAADPYSEFPIVTNPDKSTWDKRADGSEKGTGFLGLRKRPDGTVSSELSIGVEWDGVEHEIPTMVPGLTKGEMHYLMTTSPDDQEKSLPDSIKQKAVAFAKGRIAQGLSPFKQPGEGDYSPGAPAEGAIPPTYAPRRDDLAGMYAKIDANPDWSFQEKQATRAALDRRVGRDDALRTRAENDAKDQAFTIMNGLGPKGFTSINQLPPDVRRGLSSEVYHSLMDTAAQNAAPKAIPEHGPEVIALKEMAALNPKKFMQEDLRLYQARVSPAEYEELTILKDKMVAKPDAPEAAAYSQIWKFADFYGRDVGIDMGPQKNTENAETFQARRQQGYALFNTMQGYLHLLTPGKPPTDAQLKAAYDNAVMPVRDADGNWTPRFKMGTSTPTSVAMPTQWHDAMREKLRAQGLPYDDRTIANLYLEKQRNAR